MKIIDIEQGCPAWHEMRRQHIGASDASAIMLMSPWMTPFMLWEEKLGISPPKQTTPSMQRGIDFEEAARAKFILETGISVRPAVVVSETFPFMMASLDGLSEQRTCILEIKVPNKEDHEIAKMGQVPAKYFPQVQHQLIVTNVMIAYYASYDPHIDDLQIVAVHNDVDFQAVLKNKEFEFWEKVQILEPPILTDKDWADMQGNPEWEELAYAYRKIKSELDSYEAAEKALRQDLIRAAGKKNARGNGLQLTKSIRKGNVDYSLVPELDGVNLDQYRKQPCESYRITLK